MRVFYCLFVCARGCRVPGLPAWPRTLASASVCVCVLEPGYEYVLLMQDAWKK